MRAPPRRFDGVDGSARSSHRRDCFKGGVAVGTWPRKVEADLGR